MELTKEIKEILENVVYWETCPKDYKDKINAYLKSVNEYEALSIHDVINIKITIMEYVILMEFIKWCEDNGDTEWMGYYNTAEDRVGRFLKWKYDNK